ncbi:hypothetical protein [Marivita sp. XM-24bin2]|jgi:hypothetical protein|uniref:hypothetical protein n=1 Tax=unclassified Marivita TaxID=2632480 RepID=UPI0025C6BE22|nr:hypothetical protein [Marivita sp. XM-24bin2]
MGAARCGRWLLIAGLLVGIALPGLARAMAPAIVPMIAVMLCLAALREGPAAALPRRGTWGRSFLVTVTLQAVLPLAVGLFLLTLGWLNTPLAIGAVLAMAAAPITGSPGLAVMSGADATVSLRLLTLGTALLPLTSAPVFATLPLFPDPGAVAAAACRLLLVVGAAACVAASLRRVFPALTAPASRPALDGAMAVAMAVVVVGLMSEIAPALFGTPGLLALTFACAFALYFVQTLLAWAAARRALPTGEAGAVVIAAGNRNLALFLAAVPSDAAAPLMLFVGCYQVPMYLTPFFLRRVCPHPDRN